MRGVGLELWDRSSPALCSIQVQNPGATGGLTTVTTNSTLTGNGTSGSPLGVAGWAIAGFTNLVTGNNSSFGNTANTIECQLFALPYACTFSKFGINITVLDASGNYDFGLYTLAGSLVANLGAVHFPATGAVATATLQGAQTLVPGLYWACYTGNSGTMKFEGCTVNLSLAFGASATASSGGVLPGTMTPPSVAPALNAFGFTLQ